MLVTAPPMDKSFTKSGVLPKTVLVIQQVKNGGVFNFDIPRYWRVKC